MAGQVIETLDVILNRRAAVGVAETLLEVERGKTNRLGSLLYLIPILSTDKSCLSQFINDILFFCALISPIYPDLIPPQKVKIPDKDFQNKVADNLLKIDNSIEKLEKIKAKLENLLEYEIVQ